MLRFLIISVFLLTVSDSFSQEPITQANKGYLVYSRIINGDTIPQIYLPEVTCLAPHEFHNQREVLKYTKLVRNIKKVLPLAKLAKKKFKLIQSQIDKLPDERMKKEYIKMAEKTLKKDFEGEIYNMTMSQGRLLIKLIDRETGNTSYEIIKELKGSFNAFVYQSLARLFGENLKDEYDPKGDDKLIEEIIIRLENGEYQN
jgi:hypothetical protein